MGDKKILLVAACALVDADGRVLLTQRPEGKKLAGLWEFPGGKVEPGEDFVTAALREAQEEVALDPAAPHVERGKAFGLVPAAAQARRCGRARRTCARAGRHRRCRESSRD